VDSCVHIEAGKTGPDLLEAIFNPHPDYEFATCGMPEPSTYGAIFGAVGIGLVVWRRKRRSKS